MIENLIKHSQESLKEFYDHLEAKKLQEMVELCHRTKGTIFLTGIGKSGFIAEKIAMTLVSTGTKAMFLDPSNLLHGDIGIVDKDDLVIVMSKSGFTKELVELIPFIKNKGAYTIGCISQANSPLEKLCDQVLILKVASELDAHNLVPTVSTQVQLIFGDILTIALMQVKNIGLDCYASNHPSGSIGKKLLTKVDELMLFDDKVPLCAPTSKVKDILIELSMKNCGCVLVTDESRRLQGIFTDGDLRRSLQKIGTEALDKNVEELMSTAPIYVNKMTLAYEAKKVMQKDDRSWINVLPVVEQQEVIGLLRLHDLIKAGI